MKTKRQHLPISGLSAIVLSCAGLSQSASATNGTWVGNGNGTNTGNYWDTSQWTGGTVATGADATATININGTTGSGATDLVINSAVTLGTLQLTNSSGGNFSLKGNSTTLTFDVTSGTPLLAVNSWYGKVYSLGVGGLTIAGNDGLKVETGSNTIRPQSGLSWTGFSGTLEISSSGGTGGWDPQAAGLMPSVNVKLAQEAGNIEFGMFGGRNQTIGGLDGTVRAFFRNNSTTVASTLTVGANDGSGTFAGTVGMTADGLTVNGGINIVKTGAGTQEFSGPILTGTASGVTTVPTVTASGGTLILSGNNTYNGVTTINSGATLKIGNVNALGATSAGTTINSGGTLDLNGIAPNSGETISVTGAGVGNNGVLVNNGGTAVSLSQILTNTSSFSVGGSGNITLNGLSGQSGQTLTKVGAGKVTLGGTNSYMFGSNNGSVVVNNGTLVLGLSSTSGNRIADSATVSGGTLKFDPTVGTVTGGGTWGGQLNATITLSSGTLDLNGSSGQNSRIQQLIGTGGTVTNSSSTAAVLGIAARDTNQTRQFDGTIQDGTGTVALDFTATGTTNGGRTNYLTGNNSYSGGTTNAFGTLKMGHNNALGTGPVGNTATLDLNGFSLGNALVSPGNGAVFTNGSGTTATVSQGFNSVGAGSTVISDFTVNGTGNINWSGAICRTLYTGAVTKSGTNTLTLSGPGTGYAGMNYTVSGGTLAFNMTNGSTFNSGAITSTANVAGAETSGVTNTVSSAIGGSGGTFTQSGAGTTILSATNTYTGATSVNAGKLLVTGSIGSSAVTVSNTGTVLASGTTGTIGNSVTINSGAILAPGDVNAIGTATVGSGGTILNPGSIFSWDLDTTAANSAGTGYDNVITSSLAGNGGGASAIFAVVLKSGQSFSDSFWSVSHHWDNIFSTTGLAANALGMAAVFSSFTYNGSTGTPVSGAFTFTGTGGTTLTWTAVPEPTTALAGFLIGAGLLGRRRRMI